MDTLFADVAEANQKNRLLLTKQTFVMRNDDARWVWLRHQYSTIPVEAGPIMFTALAIVNAVLTQNRGFFILTTRSVQDLLRNDPNLRMKLRRQPTLPKNVGWYKSLLYTLDQQLKICTTYETQTGSATVFHISKEFASRLQDFGPELWSRQKLEADRFLDQTQKHQETADEFTSAE